MEVPVIHRISDFDVGINSINDPSFLSQAFAVSGVGKLHQAYSFWKWGALLLIALFASFTTIITRIKSLVVLRSKNINVSLPSPTLVCDDYDSDSDWSISSESSDDDKEDEDYDDEKEDDLVNGDLRVTGSAYHIDYEKGINENIPWMRRCSDSFGNLLSWPDLGELSSSGVVKLWDHLDINGEGSHRMASFSGKCGGASSLFSPAVLLSAERKGSDDVEVRAWDARSGFVMPALLAEWRQPGRILGKIIRVEATDVDKIYVGGEIPVGDMRMVNGALTELTGSDVVTMVSRRHRR